MAYVAVSPWYVGETAAHWLSPNDYYNILNTTGRGGIDVENMYRAQNVARGAPSNAAEMTQSVQMGFHNWKASKQQQQAAASTGEFPSGAPSSLSDARNKIFGTVDALRGWHEKSSPYQDLLGRQQAIATGEKPIDYSPFRSEAYDRYGASVASDTDIARADMSRRGLNLSPGAQQEIRSGARKALGSEIGNIGMQETLANRAAEERANSFISNLLGQEYAGAQATSAMGIDQYGRMQEVSGGAHSFKAGSRNPTAGSEYEQQLKMLKKYFPNAMGGSGGTPDPMPGDPTGGGLPTGGGTPDPMPGDPGTPVPGTPVPGTPVPGEPTGPGAPGAWDHPEGPLGPNWGPGQSPRTGSIPVRDPMPPTMEGLGIWKPMSDYYWGGINEFPSGAVDASSSYPQGGNTPTYPPQNAWGSGGIMDPYSPGSGTPYASPDQWSNPSGWTSAIPNIPSSGIPMPTPTDSWQQQQHNIQKGIAASGIAPGETSFSGSGPFPWQWGF